LGECKKIIWGFIPPSIPGLLLLTSDGKKYKRIELDDRRLTLCHAKIGGDKALVISDENVGGLSPPHSSIPVCYH